jgi:hypothetical protein
MERERLDEQEAFTHLRRGGPLLRTQADRRGPRGRRRYALAPRAAQTDADLARATQRRCGHPQRDA